MKSYIGRLISFKGHTTFRVAPNHNPSKPEWRTNVIIRERRPCINAELLEPGRKDNSEQYQSDSNSESEQAPSQTPLIQTDETARRPRKLTPPPPPSAQRVRYDFETAIPKEIGCEFDEGNIIQGRTQGSNPIHNAVFHTTIAHIMCLTLLVAAC